ncbi:AraC family transcriptional regulator [Myxococcus sp. RHSTA-1-4]|uniref:AraC family transcriptional regulator n=1 Tax=Myxococcus sp. RHSTA-1-4 TaxID=2874601 RepID=UPI001CBD29CF|nr:AraC family transcriptional regulator [Myxococcus sp. RHSTA-1-4]MBZ4421892.1 AraC family transcriptional regulator [Myxococcus sp. RHSTA-1-4]
MVQIEVSARIGAMIVHAAASRGVDPRVLQRATGFDAASAEDPDARIPLSLEGALWDEAARLSGDDAFGLHAAELLKPGAFDVLDYAVRTAPTLRQALERLARYNRLEHDAAVFTLHDQGDRTRVEHTLRGGVGQSRHAAEFTLASHVIIGSQITGTRLAPSAVEFRHARPASLTEHLRLFGVEPRFSTAVNAIEWDRMMLERPVLAADPALSRIVERQAQALLAARPEPVASHAERVRQLLTTALAQGGGEATLKSMAARLKMSERSLQRRLTQEGVTFDELLDRLRHELSLRYLADPKIAISEVAYLLGYSEPSPFHRAFRRWTGATPSDVRRGVH